MPCAPDVLTASLAVPEPLLHLHADLRRHLAEIGYTGWISLVQRNRPGFNLFAALANSVSFAAGRDLPQPDIGAASPADRAGEGPVSRGSGA